MTRATFQQGVNAKQADLNKLQKKFNADMAKHAEISNREVGEINVKLGTMEKHMQSLCETQKKIQQALDVISAKIKPLDETRHWFKELARGIMYVGGLALSIAAIIELLRMMGVIK